MSRYVFSISRTKQISRKGPDGSLLELRNHQLRLRERRNKDGEITAWATLHFDRLWLSGLHFAYINKQNEVLYSLMFKEGMEEFKDDPIKVSIEFLPSHLEGINWGEFANPPIHEGLSLLQGVQLHVELEDSWEAYFRPGTVQVPASLVKKLHIVRRGDDMYVRHPDEAQVDGETLQEQLYEKRSLKGKRYDTPEEIRGLLMQKKEVVSSRSGSRRRSRNSTPTPAPSPTPTSPPPSLSSIILEEEEDETF